MDAAAILDLCLLFVIGFAVFRGYFFGLVGPIFGIVAVCLGAFAAWLLYGAVAGFIPGVEAELGRKAIACVVVFVFVAGAATWLFRKFERGLSNVSLSSVNRLAGAALGALRVCLWSSFLIQVLYFHPSAMPVFERSLMTPVVLYGGFAVRLFIPAEFAIPTGENTTAPEINKYRDLQVWLTSEFRSDGTVRRTIRVTGNDKLGGLSESNDFLPTGEGWQASRRPAGLGRVTIETSGIVKRSGDFLWGLSDIFWTHDAGSVTSVADFEEEFHLYTQTPRDTEAYMPQRREGTDRWQALVEGLEELHAEINNRVTSRVAETIVIPVTARYEFPYPVEYADGPVVDVLGRVVTCRFDLSGRSPVRLTVRAVGRGWASSIIWASASVALVVVVLGAAAYCVRRRAASGILDDIYGDEAVTDSGGSDDDVGGALPS